MAKSHKEDLTNDKQSTSHSNDRTALQYSCNARSVESLNSDNTTMVWKRSDNTFLTILVFATSGFFISSGNSCSVSKDASLTNVPGEYFPCLIYASGPQPGLDLGGGCFLGESGLFSVLFFQIVDSFARFFGKSGFFMRILKESGLFLAKHVQNCGLFWKL